MDGRLIDELVTASVDEDRSPARAALLVARIAYPRLNLDHWIGELDALGQTARQHVELGVGGRPPRRARLRVVSEFFFGQLGFVGNREHYEDPRNSLLNDVILRRTGIPLSLAVVFMEVAARAGLHVEGVNFPGHFLMRCPPSDDDRGDEPALILDPFHGGAQLTEADCERLLRTHAGRDAQLTASMLQTAGKRTIVLRMLLNLKRSYVRLRDFRMARDVSQLVSALDPAAVNELRDRGLLAAHTRDYAAAVRDLEAWLSLASFGDDDSRAEAKEIWKQVTSLRKRLASMN
jgi:regulator of sirC expression with transglutaminase-like and TPR domain